MQFLGVGPRAGSRSLETLDECERDIESQFILVHRVLCPLVVTGQQGVAAGAIRPLVKVYKGEAEEV